MGPRVRDWTYERIWRKRMEIKKTEETSEGNLDPKTLSNHGKNTPLEKRAQFPALITF